MAEIHPTAIVEAGAQLHERRGRRLYADRAARAIGAGTTVGPIAWSTGTPPLAATTASSSSTPSARPARTKYAGEPTTLVIGDRNTIREFCTLNVGTVQDRGETTIGNDNWIMAYCHVAHDVQIGNQVVMANNATLAGHVVVEDWATMGGLTRRAAAHAHWRHAMVGFQAHVAQGRAALHDGG